ncbi:flagellar export chaperone FliS [Brevibacillus humidisoli]|uniref:flagellar export chaperone FliS n=1 Tax=Brevibacillus humidisoli TaxID=2895522 RepID=UPI001E35CAFF|nr:flagellar export chaperone FliS [Brevibacillus humidisoli]UFJ40044.1 flagellar export chaperone FliS [Brevibacillus humidisoli]
MLHNAAQAYQNNQVTTATPGELTLMLYNGAIRFIKQAKAAIGQQNVEQAHQHCLRVQEILYELMSTLNRDYPITEEFLKMYDYMLRRMIEANVNKDVSILSEVEELFVQFRDTWKEAMALAKQQG